MYKQNIPSCAAFWADSKYIFEKLMRSKTTKLRHERSNPNPNSRVMDFSEFRHKTYHHVQNFELILNIFLKNWCGRRHERSNPNPNSRVMDFSECRHKSYHHGQNHELILNILVKNICCRRRPSYDMNDPTLTLTVGLWTFQNVDTKHTIKCGILSWF